MYFYACSPFHVVILVAQGSFILDGSQKWSISKVSCESQCEIRPNDMHPSYSTIDCCIIHSLLLIIAIDVTTIAVATICVPVRFGGALPFLILVFYWW